MTMGHGRCSHHDLAREIILSYHTRPQRISLANTSASLEALGVLPNNTFTLIESIPLHNNIPPHLQTQTEVVAFFRENGVTSILIHRRTLSNHTVPGTYVFRLSPFLWAQLADMSTSGIAVSVVTTLCILLKASNVLSFQVMFSSGESSGLDASWSRSVSYSKSHLHSSYHHFNG
ncbi:hypothetical protein BDZ94DRAFT_985147 [Collybia nuda]|uniref:Uncharacterized protein n=1 Tax=Collybia nuda TaxID=64659 RepID=A0A9P5XZD0_9AGAR|nr:hypothetical protein BDZ94DRAFT_985147 [Collybia nuda]